MEMKHQFQRLSRQVNELDRDLHVQEQLLLARQEELLRKKEQLAQLAGQTKTAKQPLQQLQARVDAMRSLIEEQQRWVDQKLSQRNFAKEYNARHTYYKDVLKNPKRQALTSLIQKAAGYPLLISPDTLTKRQPRVQTLLKQAKECGFFCIECVPVQPGEDLWVREVEANYYQTNGEAYVLHEIQNRPVAIMTTWLLQCAWFDLVPSKVIWYDSFSTAEGYARGDDELKLYHWELLSKAAVVSETDSAADPVILLNQLKHRLAQREERSGR